MINLDMNALHRAYRSGELTPRAVISSLLERAETLLNHNIWIHRASLQELTPYLDRLAESTVDQLPLYGVPFVVKDNIDVAGMPTTAACEAFRYVPQAHATVVAHLIEAGAIPLGKTNLDQFATGLVGTRSPWGPCHNSFDPAYISGGSSSGSAVAVALGLASFSLGTDTAGSGRVPAAFNNLIGLKPTLGRLSVRGVVPACQSLDCVSVFARDAAQAQSVLTVLSQPDPDDPWQRPMPSGRRPFAGQFRLGVPQADQLEFDGDDDAEALFRQSIAHLEALGGVAVEVDFQPFTDAARLLYEGPWVAERYLATSPLITEKPEALLDVTRNIISKGADGSAADTFAAQYRLKQLKHQADQVWARVDLIMTPTTPTVYTIAGVEADPIGLNSRLGTYTNFMNLLDYAAVAVPAGFRKDGLPLGSTLFAPAFQDEALLVLAAKLHKRTVKTVGALDDTLDDVLDDALASEELLAGTLDVLVCGAHLEGLPLNHQLTSRDGVLVECTETSAAYRMHLLAGGPPLRPGMVRDTQAGKALPVEIWRLPADQFGSFVAGIPAPLGIGKVELADGRWVCGFICEPVGLEGAEEITHLGGWRAFLASVG
ncbi:allophanate hydrolase [Hydrocarboniclastica marina]|uniref:Allophanate hydrolase n=1 Tax=Hydrocarboniclastica marina TaxID=2259620 RepID=A0A4P7XM27_9ALTE|nr:allophanate hydrolase [Hydrocarboniclastica marina]QCF27057.1 allophanate hydrolase [Hydrocarboniclastica marina]